MEAGGVCKEYSNEIHIIQLPILSPSPHTYIRQITWLFVQNDLSDLSVFRQSIVVLVGCGPEVAQKRWLVYITEMTGFWDYSQRQRR